MIAAWRRLPWGLLGMLALVACVERTISRRLPSVTTHVASCWSFAGKAAGTSAKDCEVLGFGDSLVKYGFQPTVIEARTGRSAFNLAVYNGPPSHDYLMLRRVLDAGGKPAALVVCFQVVHKGSGPRFHARHFAETITPREALDLCWTSRDPGLFAWLLLGHALPSVRTRFEVRENLMTALNGQGRDWAELFAVFRRNWSRARGAHVGDESPPAPEGAAATARATELYPHTFEDVRDQVPVHEQYVRRFLDLAADRKIPVFWLLPPMLPELETRQREVGLAGLTAELAQRMSASYPNVVVVDGRGRGYDAGAFCGDAVHLNRRGAYALSRDLGDILRHHLGEPATSSAASPSLVVLPRYQPGVADVELEDLAHSFKFVRDLWRARR